MANKLMKYISDLITVLVAIVVGGLFLNGTSLANPLIGWIPVIIHTIVGWVVVVGGIIDYVYKPIK